MGVIDLVWILLSLVLVLASPFIAGLLLGAFYYLGVGLVVSCFQQSQKGLGSLKYFFCENLEGCVYRVTGGSIDSHLFNLRFCDTFGLKKAFVVCGTKSFILFGIGFVSRTVLLGRLEQFSSARPKGSR